MTDHVIRAPVDTAGQSAEFVVKPGKPLTVYLYPVASLTSGETVHLQRKDAAGTWQSVYDSGFNGTGGIVNMDIATNATDIVVTGAGTYRLNFANPTSAVGAAISHSEND